MLRRLSIVLLVLLLIASVAPSYAWKFASIADSRGSDNGVNTGELTKIVNRINAEGVDLVIFQGDAVGGSSSDSTVSSQMNTWLSVMNKLNCPWYYCPGNHEIQTSTAQNVVLRGKVNQPMNGPDGELEMVYSFDHENAHFVALNSDHYGQQHKVQTTWMAADLSKTVQPHVFVMAHDPAYPAGPHKGSSLDAYTSERDSFWTAMENGRVVMYFCGHEHLYQRTKHGAIYQVINGSCGAPLYNQSGAISKYQYVIVDINGYEVKCQAKDDAGGVIDSWSYTIPNTQIELVLASDKKTVTPSEVVTYTITYTNKAKDAALNVRIKLPIPPNTTYVDGSASDGGAYDAASNAVIWTVPSLAAGASGQCSAKVKAN